MTLPYLLSIAFLFLSMYIYLAMCYERSTDYLFGVSSNTKEILNIGGGVVAIVAFALLIWSSVAWSWWKPFTMLLAFGILAPLPFIALGLSKILFRLAPLSILLMQVGFLISAGFTIAKLS